MTIPVSKDEHHGRHLGKVVRMQRYNQGNENKNHEVMDHPGEAMGNSLSGLYSTITLWSSRNGQDTQRWRKNSKKAEEEDICDTLYTKEKREQH